jgi:hypothetical protein
MHAAQTGFDRHLPVLAAAKKMTIAWNGEHVSQKTCAVDMAKLHKVYTADDDQTFQLIFPNKPADFNQTLAAFLILRGKFALFQYGVIGERKRLFEQFMYKNDPFAKTGSGQT